MSAPRSPGRAGAVESGLAGAVRTYRRPVREVVGRPRPGVLVAVARPPDRAAHAAGPPAAQRSSPAGRAVGGVADRRVAPGRMTTDPSRVSTTAGPKRSGRGRDTRGDPATQCLPGDLAQQAGGLGRRLADLDADGLQRLLLGLRGARGAGHDRAGVTHRLALWSGEPGDVADDRLGHVVGDERRGPLLGVA